LTLAVYINLPVSGLAGILIFCFLDVKHEYTSFWDGIRAIDWTGIVTFLGFTVMVLLGLNFGGAIFPWDSAKVIALLVVGSGFVFAFIYSEAKVAKYPLIPMALFKKRANLATLSVVFFHGSVNSCTNCMSHGQGKRCVEKVRQPVAVAQG
jgi:hypothetical protein